MRLLGSVAVGRVVFSDRALPAIRLVSHLVNGDQVVIRTGADAPVATALASGRTTVLAYEADVIDPSGLAGWSVSVVGQARLVTDPAQAQACRWELPSWLSGPEDQIISIQASVVTGFRLVAGVAPTAGRP